MKMMRPEMVEMIEGGLWKADTYKWDCQTFGNRKYIAENGGIIEEDTRKSDQLCIRDYQRVTCSFMGRIIDKR